MDRFKSRKFLLALVAGFVAFANSMWQWGLTEEQVWAFLTPFLFWIGIEGVVDTVKAKNAHAPTPKADVPFNWPPVEPVPSEHKDNAQFVYLWNWTKKVAQVAEYYRDGIVSLAQANSRIEEIKRDYPDAPPLPPGFPGRPS